MTIEVLHPEQYFRYLEDQQTWGVAYPESELTHRLPSSLLDLLGIYQSLLKLKTQPNQIPGFNNLLGLVQETIMKLVSGNRLGEWLSKNPRDFFILAEININGVKRRIMAVLDQEQFAAYHKLLKNFGQKYSFFVYCDYPDNIILEQGLFSFFNVTDYSDPGGEFYPPKFIEPPKINIADIKGIKFDLSSAMKTPERTLIDALRRQTIPGQEIRYESFCRPLPNVDL